MSIDVLLEISAKATVVLLAATTIHVLLRRASAALRHLVWTTGLLTTLVIPFAVLFGPVWRIPVLPPTWSPSPYAAPSAVHERSPMTSVSQHVVSEPATEDGVDPSQVTWPLLIVIGWAAGLMLMMCRLGVGLAWVSWIVSRSTRVTDPDWLAASVEASEALRIGREVAIAVSDRTSIPVTFGVLHPTLLLPLEAERWDADRRRVVLLHELAHVKRHDCAVQALAQMARAVYWFNPLTYVALARLRAAQESACDDLVLAAGTTRARYARELMEMSAAVDGTSLFDCVTVAMARSSQLERRIVAILDQARSRRPCSLHFSALAIAVASLGVVPISAFRPTAFARLNVLQDNSSNDVSRADARVTGLTAPDAIGDVSPSVKARPVHVMRPDFAGTWTRDATRSESARGVPFYLRRDHTLTIVQTPSTFGLGSELFNLDGSEASEVVVNQDLGTFVRTNTSTWSGGELITVRESLWERPDSTTGELKQTIQNRGVRVFSLTSSTEMIVKSLRFDDALAFDGDLSQNS